MDIAIILGLILLNGVFAMSEIAVVASRQIRLQQAVDNGSESARVALQLAHDPSRFLSTIQVGITLIGILAGAYGEASIARRLEAMLMDVTTLAPYAKPLSLTLMVIIITYLTLIFGELVPKRLAMLNPEAIARVLAPPMSLLSRVARPLVWLLSASTEAMLRLLRAKRAEEPPMVEEEIHSLMRQGTAAGVLEESEQFMIRNVLRLDDLRVGNIMTLRKDVYYIDLEDSARENHELIANSPHSRIPLCRGGLDHVVGVIYAKDVLKSVMAAEEPDLAALARPALNVPRQATGLELLDRLRQSNNHIAIVADAHGYTSGIVSMTDVLEAIVGRFPTEDEAAETDFVPRRDGTWLVSGQVDITAFRQHFELRPLPEEEEDSGYHTLGGLILGRLGRVPRVTDTVEFPGLRVEVVDMDANRVDKLLVSKVAAEDADGGKPAAPDDGTP